MEKARTELENIKSAIRQGIITPTTKTMLEETEKHVANLEALLRQTPPARIAYLPSVVEACLRDLKATFSTDPDHARALLGRLIGQITLRREGPRLIAEFQGNLVGLLEMEDQVGNRGAGRGILFERHARVRVAWNREGGPKFRSAWTSTRGLVAGPPRQHFAAARLVA